MDLVGDRGKVVAGLGKKLVPVFGGKADADSSDEVFLVVESKERSTRGSSEVLEGGTLAVVWWSLDRGSEAAVLLSCHHLVLLKVFSQGVSCTLVGEGNEEKWWDGEKKKKKRRRKLSEMVETIEPRRI